MFRRTNWVKRRHIARGASLQTASITAIGSRALAPGLTTISRDDPAAGSVKVGSPADAEAGRLIPKENNAATSAQHFIRISPTQFLFESAPRLVEAATEGSLAPFLFSAACPQEGPSNQRESHQEGKRGGTAGSTPACVGRPAFLSSVGRSPRVRRVAVRSR